MANRIAHHRKRAGISQAQLSDAIGWRQSRISNYERGYRTPGIDDARAICEAFRVLGVDASLDDLFPRTGGEAA